MGTNPWNVSSILASMTRLLYAKVRILPPQPKVKVIRNKKILHFYNAALAIIVNQRKIAMETKVCTKCKKELPIEDFNWRSKEKGTRRSECKYCHTEYMQNIYADKRKLVADMKSKIKCQKCGEFRDYMLDFHHVDPSEKEYTVARLISNFF